MCAQKCLRTHKENIPSVWRTETVNVAAHSTYTNTTTRLHTAGNVLITVGQCLRPCNYRKNKECFRLTATEFHFYVQWSISECVPICFTYASYFVYASLKYLIFYKFLSYYTQHPLSSRNLGYATVDKYNVNDLKYFLSIPNWVFEYYIFCLKISIIHIVKARTRAC